MRAKTIFIIFLTVLVTVFLMINTDAVEFDFIFSKIQISKLLVIGICTFIGFLLGYLAGRPRTVVSTYDNTDEDGFNDRPKDGLSDEDREYIS